MSVKGKVPLVSSSKLTRFRTLLLDTFFAFLSNVFGDERYCLKTVLSRLSHSPLATISISILLVAL